MLVLTWEAQVLREIAFADQDHANAGNFFEYARQVFDGFYFLAHDDDENLALRVERPDVGFGVILLLGYAPVAHSGGRSVAAEAGRLEVWRRDRTRITARANGIARLLDGADVRPDDAVDAEV